MFNDDIKKYPVFFFDEFSRTVKKCDCIESIENYNHFTHNLHHFIEKSIRKNSPEFYQKIEHLQKLILVPAQMNFDLSSGMSENLFFQKYGISKKELIFNRKNYQAY